MLKKTTLIVLAIIQVLFTLTSCNLPAGSKTSETGGPQTIVDIIAPTPNTRLCENLYYPNTTGDTWEYAGSTSALGAYSRTDTITRSEAKSFMVESNSSGISYSVEYSCTEAGLLSTNPIQQYLGALLPILSGQVTLNLVSNSGLSLPSVIKPGDTWEQIAEWEGTAQGFSAKGRLVFNYTAIGHETVTISSGTYEALRVDTSILIEISNFHIRYGSYEISTWMAPNIGVIKSDGHSDIPNVDFSDSLELIRFTKSP